MKQRTIPRMSPLARWLRGVRPDHNPLRRGTDRAETVIILLTMIAFLTMAPLFAVLVDGWVSAPRPAKQERLYPVSAVLLASVPLPTLGGISRAPIHPYSHVRARWTAPDGIRRAGEIPVTTGATAGSKVTVRTDVAGRLAAQPAQPLAAANGSAALAAVFTAFGTGLVLLCAERLAHWALDKRRMAAWDSDWRSTGPQWSGRY
jgi:hypothetical protein